MLKELVLLPDSGYNCGKFQVSNFGSGIDKGEVKNIESDLELLRSLQVPDIDHETSLAIISRRISEEHYDDHVIGSEDWPNDVCDIDSRASYLLEVTLSENQFKFWMPRLEKFGYKVVSEWINPNSGNRCKILVSGSV